MRSDKERLLDMVRACEVALDYMARIHTDEEDVFRDAVLHQLTLIGEAGGNVSDELKAKYQDLPSAPIKSFRNVLVHEYFSIRWDRVWDAVDRLPSLIDSIQKILKTEFEN